MTVTTELYQSGWMPWTGVETIFVPGFSAAALDDVTVEFRSAALVVITLVRGVHYSMTLGAGSNAVTVTKIALPPAPGALRFTRDTPALQPVNFANLSGFDAGVHTRLHDQAAMRDAEIRGALQPLLDDVAPPVDPPLDPSTVMHQFDTRTAITTTTFDGSVTWVRTAGCLAVGDGGHGTYKREGASRPGGVQSVDGAWWNLVEPRPNLLQFGAVPGGVTDCYQPLADLAAYCNVAGIEGFVPGGDWLLDMAGKATITLTCSLTGPALLGARFNAALGYTHKGAFLLIKGTTASPLTLGNGSSVRHVNFEYPDQVNPAVPIVYPACLKITGYQVLVDYNTFVNPYNAIEVAAGTGFYRITNNRIAALNNGVRADTTLAENFITDNDFSYAWGDEFYTALGNLTAWRTRVQGSAVAIKYIGTNADAQKISDNVFFAYSIGIEITRTGAEAYFWGRITGNEFDACPRGIAFNGTARPVNTVITGNSFNDLGTGGLGHILLGMSGSTLHYSLDVTGNFLGATQGAHVSVASAATQEGTVIIGNNICVLAGNAQVSGGPYYSIGLNGGKIFATITGNNIDGRGNGLSNGILGTLFETLTVTGNTFRALSAAVTMVAGAIRTISGNTGSSIVSSIGGAATINKGGVNSWD